MKRLFLSQVIVLSLTIFSFSSSAQQLTVAPAHLKSDYNLSEKIDTQVKSRLERALSKEGISSNTYMTRFSMVPSIVINNEQTRATIPPKCDVEMDLELSLQDIYSGKIFASYTETVNSTGNNKQNAISLGISKIKLTSNDFIKFVEDSKMKVIAYYESQVSVIIAKAKTAMSARNFDEALYILCEIPEECPSYSSRVAPVIQDCYQQEMNLLGEKILADARAAWAASPNAEGAVRVAEILSNMPPSCSSSNAAKAFVNQICTKVEALQNWELKYLEKEQAYKHDEIKAQIEAARAIGEAYAKNQPVPIYKVNVW